MHQFINCSDLFFGVARQKSNFYAVFFTLFTKFASSFIQSGLLGLIDRASTSPRNDKRNKCINLLLNKIWRVRLTHPV